MLKRALLRDAVNGVWLDFSAPETVLVAKSAQEVDAVLARIDAWSRQGGYAAGYLSYEAAPAMDPAYECFAPALDEAPALAVFGLFSAPVLMAVPDVETEDDRLELPRWQTQESYARFAQKIDRIREEIGAGSLYQVNYTLRLTAQTVSAQQLFHQIGLSAPYGAYLDLDTATIVSGSPELFFRLQGDALESSPMKGTVARGETTEEDNARRRWLERSEKNRAENLMITDMVRNDIGRIAATGSVRTERVFNMQSLPTVWQMTSTVRGRTAATLAEIFRGLFPAASITGAPKVASMALIRALEDGPRGIYTGAIGYVGPSYAMSDGRPGLAAQFSVAIRTAWIDKTDGGADYGAGGGIVWDSRPEEEYKEVAVKSRALAVTTPADDRAFELLETIGWSAGSGFDHLPAHLDRLQRSSSHYGFPLDIAAVRARLDEAGRALAGTAGRCDVRWRVRLCLGSNGEISVSTDEIELSEAVQPVMLAAEPVRHDDLHLSFKTTRRGVYERADSSVPDGVEALLWNDLGRVTESSIANLVYVMDGRRFTPPQSDGLLPGVLRVELVAEGRIQERSLAVAELGAVEALYLVNGLRGWRQAEFQKRG